MLKCYNCGEYGHTAGHCVIKLGRKYHATKAEKKALEAPIKDADKLPSFSEMRVQKDDWMKEVECYRFGKFGHFASHCPDQDGNPRFARPPRDDRTANAIGSDH